MSRSTSIYLWLSVVYAFEAWKRATPWLFTDELELTQLSRSIATTGRAARRGQPHSFRSLYTVMTAPVWLIHDVATAYAGIRYLDVFVMTSVVFPVYLLARLVVGKYPALFAAIGVGVTPALAYSSWIIEETIAYPYAAWCLYLIARALLENRATPRRYRWATAAAVLSAVAPAVRGELVVVPIVYAFAIAFTIWSSDWAHRRRTSWTWGDWVGCLTLVVGAGILISGFASHHYSQWYSVTQNFKPRIFILGDWAVGAYAVGLGVIPLVLGLAALVPVRGERKTQQLRIFRCVSVAGLLTFGLYSGMKAAYLSTVFATRVEERNLIYIAPLLFVGMALVLERRSVNMLAVAAAAAYALYVVVGTPFFMTQQLYSDALGLAILQQANRYFAWTPATGQWLVVGVLALGLALIVAFQVLQRRRVLGIVLAGALALGIVAWNAAGEVAAAVGTVSISRDEVPTLGRPFSWVDDVTHQKATLYLAQGVGDQDPEWFLEFWNRSITRVSSTDGTLGGPGPSGAPNTSPTGIVYWSHDPANPGDVFAYGVEDWPCIDFAGTLRAKHEYRGGGDLPSQWRLIQLTRPNRLRAECSGLYPDGWSGANDSEYFRFAAGKPGWLRIDVARQNWPPTPVLVQVGTIVDQDHEAVLGTVRKELKFQIPRRGAKTIWLPTDGSRFAVRVFIVNKFVPHDIDPRSGDVRVLGAQVNYHYCATLTTRGICRRSADN